MSCWTQSPLMGKHALIMYGFIFVNLNSKIKCPQFIYYSSRWTLNFPAIELYFEKVYLLELPSNAISMVFYKHRTVSLIQHSKGDL